ncbi:MAG: protein kinase [Clostridiales bacterium]|nr:protein kinase [Clostridiales bacterium]
MEFNIDFEGMKKKIKTIESVFDFEIKVLYRLSEDEKDVFLIDYHNTKMKLRIIDESEKEIKKILMLSKVQNENIEKIRFYKVSNGKIYILTNYFEGITLFDYVEFNGVLSEKDALSITKKISLLLGYLHKVNPYPLIFRDLQPKNIIIDNGLIYLIDLETISVALPDQNHDEDLIGTVGFMAPEQYGFGQADTRTDIYNLGKCLYFMLSGKLPVLNHQNIDYSAIQGKSSTLKILKKMTEFSPDRRFQNVDKIVASIDRKGRKNYLYMSIAVVVVFFTIVIVALINDFIISRAAEEANSSIKDTTSIVLENAVPVHFMPLEFEIYEYDKSFDHVDWRPLVFDSSDIVNNDSSMNITYGIHENNVYIRYQMDLHKKFNNISFNFSENRYGLNSFLDISFNPGRYDYIQSFDMLELNYFVKQNYDVENLMDLAIGDENGEVYNIDIKQVFIENSSILAAEKHTVAINGYDFSTGDSVEDLEIEIDTIAIDTDVGSNKYQFSDWNCYQVNIDQVNYLKQINYLKSFRDENFNLPMLKSVENRIQGFIKDCIFTNNLTTARIYLIEKTGADAIIVNRKDYMFYEFQYFSFEIDPLKEYILGYEIIDGSNYFDRAGYIGEKGIVKNFNDADIITAESIEKRSYNLNLVSKYKKPLIN